MSYVNSKKTLVTCCVCKKKYLKYKSAIFAGQRLFCSRICYNPNRNQPVEERFWKHVNKTESCWLWTASTGKKGYGKINVNGVTKSAHRVSYEMSHGAIPRGLGVLHKCDTPLCVRPDHLFIGTNQDNVNDMMSKGRHHVQKTKSRKARSC